MGFVNEEIEEKDRERYYSFNLIGPYTKDKLEAWKWTIDKERDAILIILETGRDYEHPCFFVFIWKNKIIRITTFLKKDIGKALYWNLYSIGIPESLKDEKDEILQAILEAFKEHGYIYIRIENIIVIILFLAI